MSIESSRQPNGRWRRGHSGNPDGRRAETDPERRRIRALARDCGEEIIGALRSIALDEDQPGMARVQASKELLARGLGSVVDEATVAALDRGPEDDNVIRFVMPMSLDGVVFEDAEIEDGELVDVEPPALPPPAA